MQTCVNDYNLYEKALLNQPDDITVCIIGAGEGFLYEGSTDPIRRVARPDWKYIFIEPNKDAFHNLVENQDRYGESAPYFIHGAVARQRKVLTLYRVAGPARQHAGYRTNITSSSKNHVLKHLEKLIEAHELNKNECIDSFEVIAYPLPELLHERRPDVFQVDCEGMDDEVVRHIIKSGQEPEIILFEHIHLSRTRLKKLVDLLCGEGYQVSWCSENDTIACKNCVTDPD